MIKQPRFLQLFNQQLRIRHLYDKDAAAEIGISRQTLSQMKKGQVPPNDKVADWMGYDRKVTPNPPTITFTKKVNSRFIKVAKGGAE